MSAVSSPLRASRAAKKSTLHYSLRHARDLSLSAANHQRYYRTDFYLDKNYSISCLGAPNKQLLSLLATFLEVNSKHFPLATSSPLQSQELLQLHISTGSSSSSSVEPGTRANAKRLRASRSTVDQVHSPQRSERTSSDSDSSRKRETGVSKAGQKKPRSAKGSNQTINAEVSSDSSVTKKAESKKPTSGSNSSSSNESSKTATSKGKGKSSLSQGTIKSQTKKSVSVSASPASSQPSTSTSVIESSQIEQKFAQLWRTERIPVGVIYTRAEELHKQHRHGQYYLKGSHRVYLCREDFVDQAEEELATECLAAEFFYADLPNSYAGKFRSAKAQRKLANFFIELNEFRSSKGLTELETYLEYYWDLNTRGHCRYSEDYYLDSLAEYVPSVYRRKVLRQDIQAVQQYKLDKQIRTEQQAPSYDEYKDQVLAAHVGGITDALPLPRGIYEQQIREQQSQSQLDQDSQPSDLI